MGQGRGGGGGGGKAFFKQWYGLHSPTDVEFTFNYQMIPHYPFRHVHMSDSVLHTFMDCKILPYIIHLIKISY